MIGSRGVMLAGVAAILFAAGANGATARKGPVRKRAAAPVAKPVSPTQALSTQLVLNRTLVGEGVGEVCRRASFKNLAVALNMNRSMLDREKGEFETDAEFADLSGKIERLMAGEPIIFCESLDDNPDISFKYKADDQVFEGSFSKNHNVWRDVKALGSYRTKTRMGVPVTVKSSAEFEYEIALDMKQDMVGCVSGSYSYDFRVPHPISTAPALKALGKIAFQVRLAAPYVTLQESPGEASLDNPYDVYTYAITLHGKPEKIYVVDGAGKEVWSCRVGALNPLQEAKPVGSSKTWVWISDYPTSGYRQRAEGTVKATLDVGADGTVQNCGITSSSGFPDLDSATCSAWKKRGKFVPASDKDGNPVASQVAISRGWTSYGGTID